MRFCRVVQSCGGNAKRNDVMSCPPTSLFSVVRFCLTARQPSACSVCARGTRIRTISSAVSLYDPSAYMPTWTIPGRTLLNTSEVVENPVARPDDASRVLQMVITAIIFLVGIPLNALVVWVLGLRRSHYKRSVEGRGVSSFRVYVVNLALADLMLLLRTPLMLGYLAHHKTWPFGLTVCRLIMFLRGLGLYANAFLLCAISMERCLCLMRPVWFRMRRSWWTVPLICAILWLLATSLSAPYIWTACLINGTQCWESTGTTSQGLFITESILGFLLPLVIFLSSNLAVLFTAQQAGQAMASSSSTSQRFVRLYRVLFFTMLFFLTCWVPYYTFRFLMKLAAEKPDWEDLKKHFVNGTYISLFLVYIKSALNPLIYVFATRGLRRTIQASLISTVDRIFNDDTSDYTRRKSLRRQDSQF
ncbi:C3a anaphylatoxin chemotactic receptor isoform X1 [Scleropages formosus]|uniref:C3a anaphylatoxin chemotactic receptor isoform X1 n=1 Tax=Scleropages formosus TaxID=113540 RepID=UPI00087855DA|nr:C3a anaphylatoxin chemotactic receptor-like isoform X1 [Scleropages formosus]